MSRVIIGFSDIVPIVPYCRKNTRSPTLSCPNQCRTDILYMQFQAISPALLPCFQKWWVGIGGTTRTFLQASRLRTYQSVESIS